MAMHFDRWEKDPYFSAAEEVQESADRMESTYRTWLHASKDASSGWDVDELRRDLRTALGTTKWQLEEFDRAVRSSYKKGAQDEAIDRHHQFVLAMEEKVSLVENSLQESAVSEGKTSTTQWMRLDEGERDELALFLSGPTLSCDKLDIRVVDSSSNGYANPCERSAETVSSSMRNGSYASGLHLMEGKKVVKLTSHRRTASAADIRSLSISVNDDKITHDSSSGSTGPPPRRVPSYSGFISTVKSASQLKLPKNGFRKWKAADRQQEDDIALLRPQELSRETTACCEKSKSCLNTGDDCRDKQLHGWYGAIQRLLQRSQYQVQYSRSIQLTCWTVLLLFFIVLFILRAI